MRREGQKGIVTSACVIVIFVHLKNEPQFLCCKCDGCARSVLLFSFHSQHHQYVPYRRIVYKEVGRIVILIHSIKLIKISMDNRSSNIFQNSYTNFPYFSTSYHQHYSTFSNTHLSLRYARTRIPLRTSYRTNTV